MILRTVFFVATAALGTGIHAADLVTPPMSFDAPAAGKRVWQQAPEYRGTDVYHSLYLPRKWIPEEKYPVLVEFTGNKFPPSKGSGEVKDANLGYGISGGTQFIWIVMPYIAMDKNHNAVTWWGNREATVQYCKQNISRICEEFGGDLDNLLICGFSRGAIATSYIGLADDEIAGLWKAVITHDHFDGVRKWPYPHSDRQSALHRLSRLQGRPVLVCGLHATAVRKEFLAEYLELADFTFLDVPVHSIFNIPEGPYLHSHTDLWMHRPSSYRDCVRNWVQKVIQDIPQG